MVHDLTTLRPIISLPFIFGSQFSRSTETDPSSKLKDASTMRNVSKFLAPALFAGVMAASMPAMAATHSSKPAKVQKVKTQKVEKKHSTKAAKGS
jgi:uncharacterized membrane protein